MAADWQPVKEEILILGAATSVVILQLHLSSAVEADCQTNKYARRNTDYLNPGCT